MKQADFEKLVDESVAQMRELLIVKGGEYAGSEDRLANFKRGAGLTGATAMQVLFIYLSKHYDAIATYIRDDAVNVERPRSESIRGRVHDALNYLLLLEALIVEREEEKHNAAVEKRRDAQKPATKTRRPNRDRRSKRAELVVSGGDDIKAQIRRNLNLTGR